MVPSKNDSKNNRRDKLFAAERCNINRKEVKSNKNIFFRLLDCNNFFSYFPEVSK